MKVDHIFLITLLFNFSTTAQAGVGDWTTYTSQTDVRDLRLVGDDIWFVTNGGVFVYQITTGSYQQFNNTNGLTSLDAQAIEIDQKGNVWVGFTDGWINYYDATTRGWKRVPDYLGHPIFDLEAIGDSLLIALDIGISLYDVRRKEVKETYKHLGWQFSSEINVYDIMISQREIWAATGLGIARTSFELANLMAPESWTNYTTDQGLPGNQINSIVAHGDSIYAGTNKYVAILRGQNWVTINQGLYYQNVRKLYSNNNALYAVTYSYVSRWDPGEYQWRNVAPDMPELTSLAVATNGDLWVGREKSGSGKGFAKFSIADRTWELLVPPGPPGNTFNGLAVDKDGVLWCASPQDGIFRFDGKTWRQFTTADGLINNGLNSMTVDSRNRKWSGSIGGGLVMIDNDEKISVFHHQILSGSPGSPDWVIVSDVKVDRYNNIWVLNKFAANNNVIAVYTPQLDWYFFAVQEGILSDAVTSLDFDQVDRVWVGTQAGVTVIDYKNTLAIKSDDIIRGNNLTMADGLENNSIKDIAIDQDNVVWIASEGGLNYWDPRTPEKVYSQTGLLNNAINTIEIDIRNNIWFGTSAGVSMLAFDRYSWTHYTTDNSPLVNDNVTSFSFDSETGKVYIGTANGLSCLETPFSRPRENLNNVKTGPNPFNIKQDIYFAISELSDDVSIMFLTENGMIVRHISNDEILGSYTTWDGKNDEGEPVATGIYIYVIYNEETGLNQVGKVAVIR